MLIICVHINVIPVGVVISPDHTNVFTRLIYADEIAWYNSHANKYFYCIWVSIHAYPLSLSLLWLLYSRIGRSVVSLEMKTIAPVSHWLCLLMELYSCTTYQGMWTIQGPPTGTHILTPALYTWHYITFFQHPPPKKNWSTQPPPPGQPLVELLPTMVKGCLPPGCMNPP